MAFASIPVQPATQRRFRAYLERGEDYDAALNRLMDAVPPEVFAKEHQDRAEAGETVAWADLREHLLRS
ncbi:MAG: hypothetical protein ACPGQL_07465 [Thermoplasmatota archaeon]